MNFSPTSFRICSIFSLFEDTRNSTRCSWRVFSGKKGGGPKNESKLHKNILRGYLPVSFLHVVAMICLGYKEIKVHWKFYLLLQNVFFSNKFRSKFSTFWFSTFVESSYQAKLITLFDYKKLAKLWYQEVLETLPKLM